MQVGVIRDYPHYHGPVPLAIASSAHHTLPHGDGPEASSCGLSQEPREGHHGAPHKLNYRADPDFPYYTQTRLLIKWKPVNAFGQSNKKFLGHLRQL